MVGTAEERAMFPRLWSFDRLDHGYYSGTRADVASVLGRGQVMGRLRLQA